MKKILLLLIVFPFLCYSQSNEEISKKSLEIIQWINTFEDNNSVERIMKGTFADKVYVEYNQGKLIVYSMLWQGSREPIMNFREIIEIKDIIRIEAKKKFSNDNIIADIAIFVKEGSINLECKNRNEVHFYPFSLEKKWFDKVGFCSLNLRFKFSKEIASTQIERVFNALSDLTILNGGSPKIGSLY